jgi:hypothetical protein
MSKRYPGNFITGNPVALSQTSNNGIWDVKDVSTAVGNSTWQEPSGIYGIAGSLRGRENASTYFSRTPTSSTSDGKTFTISAWVKRSKIGTYQIFFSAGATTITNGYVHVGFNSDDKLYLSYYSSSSHVYSTDMLFRDPSAWYHMMLVLNTSTGAQGHAVYVNGRQVALVRNTNYSELPANFASLAGRQAEHRLFVGSSGGGTRSGFLDGYMTEVNFVDGQALDPSYFGYTDSITGIWQPKRYTGTYGTNGFYLPLTSDNISHSIYQNGTTGDYQTVSASNLADISSSTQTFTYEAWICPFAINASGPQGFRFTYLITKGIIYQGFGFTDTGVLRWYTYDGNTQYVESAAGVVKNGIWQHVAVVSTAGAIKLYANGTLVASGTLVAPSAGNNLNPRLFGGDTNFSTDFFNGYCSNFRITNTAVYSSNFTPSRAPLTNISGTQFLGFQSATNIDSGPNGYTITGTGSQGIVKGSPFGSIIGYDASGTGSTFKPFNFGTSVAVSGTSFDIMVDSPTNVFTTATDVGGVVPGNYPTIDPLEYNQDNITYSNANLSWSQTANPGYGPRATTKANFQLPKTGKWVFAITIGAAGNNAQFGIARPDYVGNPTRAAFSTTIVTSDYAVMNPTGGVVKNGTEISTSSAIGIGDELQCAVDCDAGIVSFYKNGSYIGQATGMATTTNNYWPMTFGASSSNSGSGSWNFGQRPFAYAPPAGFKTLNTTNLQALGTAIVGKAAITPNKWMNVNLDVGAGSTPKSVTGVGFRPDLVIRKTRNTSQNPAWYDSVRGGSAELRSNELTPESYNTNLINSFDADGFSYGSSFSSVNSYYFTSFRQSPTSGFSIIPYTGNNSAQTISHNLGVAPKMVIVKNRTGASRQWTVYHSGITNSENGGIYLNLGNAWNSDSTLFNNTAPTASNITIGTYYSVSGEIGVIYAFAEVPGFSSFGSYMGSGSTDGTFIYTGFRPKYILWKRTNGATDWHVHLTAVDAENPSNNLNFIGTSTAESANTAFSTDILSNGFKLRTTDGSSNGSGQPYIYAAFAESPFALNNRAR